ncbi:MAG: hypothetical protein P8X74_18980 [Reinekea sp.]|jgi:hypothetical protein
MPEMGGMDPTAMVDPIQTDAMWALVWQFTGRAGTFGVSGTTYTLL